MEEPDPIPLSALQHWLFCPRQCALIHLERLWAENLATVEGRLLHERTDVPGAASRKGGRVSRSLALAAPALGIAGVADVVEWYREGSGPWRAYPVEYKRGRPKAHRADEVQLAAQALCLEAMTGLPVPEGALFYGRTRRRLVVAIDAELRALTLATVDAIKTMLESDVTPPAVYEARRCDTCSMVELCRPKRLARPPDVARWLHRRIEDGDDAGQEVTGVGEPTCAAT